jgi:hypothetical protein
VDGRWFAVYHGVETQHHPAVNRCHRGHSNLRSSAVHSREGYRGEVPPAGVGFTKVCATEIRPPALCPAERHPLKVAHSRRAPLRCTQGRRTRRRSAVVRFHRTPAGASRHRCYANTPYLSPARWGWFAIGLSSSRGPAGSGTEARISGTSHARSEGQWVIRLSRSGTLHAFCRAL